ALTASAMTDELERCTAAGMDGLIAKPLELPRLREVLDRFGMRSGTASAAAGGSVSPLVAAASAVVQASPVDLEQLRTLVGDDRAFLRELCETFVSSSSRIVEELGRAISDGD